MFSIVVPFWNRSDLLETTVDSVLAQTRSDWELLLVDDGSTDGANRLAMEYAEADERVRFYQRPEDSIKGAPTCRNVGSDEAEGRFVLFLDSDDTLEPHCLERRFKYFETQGEEFDAVVFQGGVFNEAPGDSDLILARVDDPPDDPLDRFLGFDWPWQTSQPLWRRSALQKHELRWKEGLLWQQDGQFHIDALISGMKIGQKLAHWAPDFLMRSGTERERVTRRFGTARQIESTSQYFCGLPSRLRDAGLLTDHRRQALVSLLFWFSEQMVDERGKRSGVVFWSKALRTGEVGLAHWFPGLVSLLSRKTRLWNFFGRDFLRDHWGPQYRWQERKRAKSFAHPPCP